MAYDDAETFVYPVTICLCRNETWAAYQTAPWTVPQRPGGKYPIPGAKNWFWSEDESKMSTAVGRGDTPSKAYEILCRRVTKTRGQKGKKARKGRK
jgi:hypothetical protein